MTGRIVVGVDGSPGSHRALQWAAQEAELRGASIEAVAVYEQHYDFGQVYTATIDPIQAAAIAAEQLSTAVKTALGDAAAVRQTVLHGDPAAELCAVSKDAELLVLGSRGHGGFVEFFLGSVSTKCSHHAPCPVVVVPAKS